MQVNCPNCGAKVTAEKINIQKMTAVCTACDTVFRFDLPEAKAKRRKVKPPVNLSVHDGDTLQMDFWTNFKLERSENFLSSIIGGFSMAFVALMLILSGGVPSILPIAFVLLAALLFYWSALIVVNKTHIEMDQDAIRVIRKPIPNPLNHGDEISLAGVVAIRYEETAISKKEAYDLPRYRVWAETADGSRRTIVNDVTEEYAVFITQRLDERLQTDADSDVSRLEDGGFDVNDLGDEMDLQEVVRASQNRLRP